MTPTPSFKVTPFFDAEYLRNGTGYRHCLNEILIGTQQSFGVTSSDLKVFNDTKRRTDSLRQRSFLFLFTCSSTVNFVSFQ